MILKAHQNQQLYLNIWSISKFRREWFHHRRAVNYYRFSPSGGSGGQVSRSRPQHWWAQDSLRMTFKPAANQIQSHYCNIQNKERKKRILLFFDDAIHWSKRQERHTLLQQIYCSFELHIRQRILNNKSITVSTKTLFSTDNNQKCFLNSESVYYYDFWRSCDTEDWSNDAENTDLIKGINYILQQNTVILVVIFHNFTVFLIK